MRAYYLGVNDSCRFERRPLARTAASDGLVSYSPGQSLRDEPVRAFTAVGLLQDDELWQGDEGDWRPWRRIRYSALPVPDPIIDLRGRLELTTEFTWGHRPHHGPIPLSDGDFVLICRAMTESVADGHPAQATPVTPSPAGPW
jgi:hypothetical protein